MALPVNTVVPTITGTAQVGNTLTASIGAWVSSILDYTYLTASTGTWVSDPTTFAYQWYQVGVGAITGATAYQYSPVSGDVGHQLQVYVTGTDTAGTSSAAMSSATATVASGAVPVNTVAPTITGTAQDGDTLTVSSTGTWTNTPITGYTYLWNGAGSPLNTSSYACVVGDVGNNIHCAVTASNANGAGTAANSNSLGPVAAATVSISVPGGGTPQVGQMLTASGGSGSYQWYLEGSAISGATSSTYTLLNSAQGGLIQVNRGGVYSALYGPVLGSTVRYVSYSGGSDSYNGQAPAFTSGTTGPWKTLTHVNAQSFSAGTSILFNRGDVWPSTGTEDSLQLLPSSSGTSTQPIVYGAYGTGSKPRLSGGVPAGSTSNWDNPSGNIWTSHQTFSPSVGNGKNYNNANDIGNVLWGTWPDGISTGFLVYNAFANSSNTSTADGYLTAQGNWYFNTSDYKVHLYCVGNPATTLGSSLVLALNKVGLYFNTSVSYNIFENIDLSYFGASAILQNQITLSNIIIRDMNVGWTGGGNLGGAGVRYGDFLDLQSPYSNILIERCFVFQQYDAGAGPQPYSGSGSEINLTVRNCIFTGCGATVFYIFGISGYTQSGFYFYNNSVYNPTSWDQGQRWGTGGNNVNNEDGQLWGFWLSTGGTVNGPVMILNNSMDSMGTTSPTGAIYFDDSQNEFPGHLTADYNLYSLAGGGVPQYSGGGTSVSLASWASTYSQEAHGHIRVSANYTNPTSLSSPMNFYPNTGSALFGNGENLYSSGVVWDFGKNPRPSSGAFTIGAWQ